MRKYIVAILVVMAMVATGFMVTAPSQGSPSAAVQEVSFLTSDPTNMVSMNSSVIVTYDDQVDIYGDDSTSVSYDIQPGDLVLTLFLRLSALNIGLQDETITVPVTDTQLIEQEISLTQYLTSVPAAIASVDMVIKADVSMAPHSTSSQYCRVETSPQSLTWSQWGSKTFPVDSSEDGLIRTGLTYKLSVGVVANALDVLTDRLSVTLIPNTVLSSSIGDTPLVTTVDVQAGAAPTSPTGNLYPVMWMAIVVVAVAAVLSYIIPLARKRSSPCSAQSPSGVPVQGGFKYCGTCGQQFSRCANYCPRCGRGQR